ncbi:NupC/NupG family nucleoside CNT transporter [candidate division KSB1 bacterium]|nr:NupC/NupG family nucleoside CNT transporter [candidate division KSB1 bacterium]
MERLISVFGCFVLIGIAWLLSNNKRQINYRVVVWGLLLQLVFAVIILKTAPGQAVFFYAKAVITKLLSFTDIGAEFLFGNLYRGDPGVVEGLGGGGPYQIWDPGSGSFINIGISFAMHVLPTIIFFASLMSILYHLGVMQKLVRGVAWVMAKVMGTSGAESLSVASNIFVGQTEAPLVIRPFVAKMTQSELMAVMCGGFATIAGGVMAAYVRFGADAGHLMAASVMSAPAALVMAKIIFPETEQPETAGTAEISVEKTTVNVVDAAATGAADGLKLALNVGAMLLAFYALIHLLDFSFIKIGSIFGLEEFGLKKMLGYAFAPLALVMGVETADVLNFGYLLGTKISLNEFVAFVQLGEMKETLSPRSFTIGTYALCGFANFSSIAIQIGGIGSIAPERKGDLARLGLKAMIGGALASFLTATIAGILI